MAPIDIEFSNIEKFNDLIETVSMVRKGIDEQAVFNVNDITISKKETDTIIPLMYKVGYISDSFDTLAVFDIAFELDDRNDSLDCLFRRNNFV